jgi:predicted transcriptional regulator
MRTTIRIPDDQREKLLELATRRGDRGCARVVQEAVAQYLEQRERAWQPPAMRAETRAERAWVLLGWLWEEAAGLAGVAHTLRGRLRRWGVAG